MKIGKEIDVTLEKGMDYRRRGGVSKVGQKASQIMKRIDFDKTRRKI